MISIQQLPKIVLTATLTTLSSLLVAPAVFAITSSFNISGTFDDGGTLTGFFVYDSDLEEYKNVNINTTTGSVLTGTTYSDDDSFFGSANGVTIVDSDTDLSLNLVFVPDLTETSPSFDLGSSYEEDFNANRRDFDLGTIAAVPFDFSPNLGVMFLVTTLGIQFCRHKLF